jgi:hypothetical protein
MLTHFQYSIKHGPEGEVGGAEGTIMAFVPF